MLKILMTAAITRCRSAMLRGEFLMSVRIYADVLEQPKDSGKKQKAIKELAE